MTFAALGLLTCFGMGFLLRHHPKHNEMSQLLMQGVVYIAFPSFLFPLVYLSPLKFEFGTYVLFVPILLIISGLSSAYVAKKLALPRLSQGSFFTSSLVINTGLMVPFVLLFFGESAAGLMVILDILFSILAFSIVLLIASRYSESRSFDSEGLKRAFLLPPVWAIVLAVLLRFSPLTVPSVVLEGILWVGKISILMLPVAIGMFFRLDQHSARVLGAVVGLRVVLGGIVGAIFVTQFDIAAPYSHAIMVCAIAPTGMKGVMISRMAGLDETLLVTAISLTSVVSLLLVSAYGFLVL